MITGSKTVLQLHDFLRGELRAVRDVTNFQSAAPGGGYVLLFVRGHYSGAYEFRTLAEAEQDAGERRRDFGILGCGYVVSESPENPRP